MVAKTKESDVFKFGKLEIPIEEFTEFIAGLAIDAVHLDELAQDFPVNKARVSVALEKMKAKSMKAKADLKTVYYKLYREFKENSDKKLTEEHIKAKIYTDERYIKVNNVFLEIEERVGLLSALNDSMDSFGRMLYLLGDNRERTF